MRPIVPPSKAVLNVTSADCAAVADRAHTAATNADAATVNLAVNLDFMASIALCLRTTILHPLLSRVFIPNHVLAQLSGDEQVQVAILIQIDGPNVVGRLIDSDQVTGEVSSAIVLKPHCVPITVGAGSSVDIAVTVHIDDDQAVGLLQRLMDDVFVPQGRLKPDDAASVAARRHKIHLAVSVHIRWLNICSTGLLIRDHPLRPGFGAIGRCLPPGEPFAAARYCLWSAFGCERNIRAAVTVDIADAEIMAKTRRILVGKHKSLPAVGQARRFRHAKPHSRVGKTSPRLSAVGDEVVVTVAVDIALEQPMDAIDLVIDEPQLPALRQRLVRLL